MSSPVNHVKAAHAFSVKDIERELSTRSTGLSAAEAQERLEHLGPNQLPAGHSSSWFIFFIRQFKSPLIYVLLAAALVSAFLHEYSDAGFIFAVLIINALIGTYQEFSAERSAQALQAMVSPQAQVIRDGKIEDVDASLLVPGDKVLLESGTQIPADLRLIETHNLSIDESLLTGESVPSNKASQTPLTPNTPLGDRANMAFAGTMVNTGRAVGFVTGTGVHTEIGQIASSLLGKKTAQAPLLERMERFTRRIALAVAIAALAVTVVQLIRGVPLTEIFMLAVALAVSAIPEGLPVAVTVALAVGMGRMAKRAVIVRKLVAVEALGSCTLIASDKTGTLTVNQLTVKQVQLPHEDPWHVSGEGLSPTGCIAIPEAQLVSSENRLMRLCTAATLTNEASLREQDGRWQGHGDSVDLALLTLSCKAGHFPENTRQLHPEIDNIPYESEKRYSASLNATTSGSLICVKGALETLLPMCSQMSSTAGNTPLDAEHVLEQAQDLAADGYRVLALASAEADVSRKTLEEDALKDLVLLGLVAMSDPPRPEAKQAIRDCQQAGISVAMITGDHPLTAAAISQDLGITDREGDVVTGVQLAQANDRTIPSFDELCARHRVFARVEPEQKLQIVQALQRQGHFVAVTGDGVNDAPALRTAQVGVAMGDRGTDVARETAEIILTDDNFSSIVAGVEEGRVAYANIRKVLFLLISTGAAEIVLFLLALIAGHPLPLVAVQLLWLNLVTNGIQDVALAFEPAEGKELKQAPRPPQESIFNRIMIERTLVSSLVIGVVAFVTFEWMLTQGWSVEESRNGVLLLMVLFENIQAYNSRSETLSVLKHNPMRNRLLLFGTIAAQLIHIAAMYTPGLNTILGISPVSIDLWLGLLGISLCMLVVMEGHKLWWKKRYLD